MVTRYKVKIDLELLRNNFFKVERKPSAIEAVKDWLRIEKFKELPDGRWLCKEPQLKLLDPAELLSKEVALPDGHPPGYPLSEIPADRIVEAAQEHAVAARLLFSQFPKLHVIHPFLMCASFSIELHLKSLNSHLVYEETESGDSYLVTFGVNKWGHKLSEQFDDLDEPYKNALSAEYAAKPVIASCATLREALSQYDNTFEQSRYSFESGNSTDNDLTGLLRLAEFVAGYVASLGKSRPQATL